MVIPPIRKLVEL